MAIRSLIANAKQFYKLQSLLNRKQSDVPKGHLVVYVGEFQKKRYVVPISYLNHPSFQDLLHRAEEEFGFNHPMGGLTIPCSENAFVELTSRMHHKSFGRGIHRSNSDTLESKASYVYSFHVRINLSILNNPSFQDLLTRAEEEFGFNHPMGGLTIPCSENTFVELTSRMHLNDTAFQDLLRQAEEEFVLTILWVVSHSHVRRKPSST